MISYASLIVPLQEPPELFSDPEDNVSLSYRVYTLSTLYILA